MWRSFSLVLWLSVAALWPLTPALAAQIPVISPFEAIHHIGELATVCGSVAGRHPTGTVPNLPTFIDLGQPFPHPVFTIVVYDGDRKLVGDLPLDGNVCVTGTIRQYLGIPMMVLDTRGSWTLQASPPLAAAPAPESQAFLSSAKPAPVPHVAAPRAPLAFVPRASIPAAPATAAPAPAASAPAASAPADLVAPAARPPVDSAPAAAAIAASPALSSSSYSIGADDSLQVTVWHEPTLSGTLLVRPDGKISMVLLGDIRAAGLTPMELAGNLTERFRKFIQDPLVSVIVAAPNSQKIYIIGEVQHVGPILMATAMSPLQAIAAAGGLTPYAKPKKIYILRGPQGQQEKIPFNYKNALNARTNTSVRLLAGDTIVVP